MQLRLTDSNDLLTKDFGDWLLPFIQVKLLSSFQKYNFKAWDNFLTTSVTLRRLYKRNYTALEIIQFACKNLYCTGRDGDIIIGFNTSKYVPGFDRVKLATLIKTINYGTLQVKGTPIFTDTLDEFAQTINIYVEKYYGI